MADITKKLNQLLYLGTQPFNLVNLSATLKQQIKLIRQINASGTGYVSFNPASGVNSLSQVVTGGATGHVIVETVSSTPNFTLPDFGVWTGAVAPSNAIPVASAATPAALTLPNNQVALTGSATDADGTVVAHEWRQVTGPNNATGLPGTAASIIAGGLIAGTYQFGYKARDNAGAYSAEQFVNVTVNAAPSGNVVDVYIIGGQSNAEGGADLSDRTALPELASKNLTRSMPGSPIWNYTVNQFQPLNVNVAGVGNQYGYTHQPPLADYFGAELAVAHLLDLAAKPAYFIKYAIGATSIDRWLPTGDLRPRLDQSVRDGLAAIAAMGKTPRVHMLWCQGENDASMTAAAYQQKLTTLFNSFYADWLPASANVAITMLRPAFDPNGSIRAAQQGYAATNNKVVLLHPETWEARTDAGGVHYNGNGQYAQGKAFYEVSQGTYVPPNTTAPSNPNLIQETDARWTYAPVSHSEAAGNWRVFPTTSASSSSLYYMDAGYGEGKSATFPFSGNTCVLHTPGLSVGRIKFDVYVDDVLKGTVDVPATASASAPRLSLSGLGSGNHTLRIQPVAAYNAFAVVDAIDTAAAGTVEPPAPTTNYAARFAGAAPGQTARIGNTDPNGLLNMGANWAIEIRHRTRQSTAQYLVNIGWGAVQLAVIRGFAANRYQVYAQGEGSNLSLVAPVDTALDEFYRVRAECDGITLRILLNGTQVATQAVNYSYPPSPGLAPTLMIASGVTSEGSDYGDYDYVQIEKNGAVLDRWDFVPGTTAQTGTTGALGVLNCDAEFIQIS